MPNPRLKEGHKAPAFTLKNAMGETVRLSDFKGQTVVLYFYPKDNTPGCTREACAFTTAKKKFEQKNTVILGVSPDSEKSHQGFIAKQNLTITLLSDPDRKTAEKYGVYREKKLYGKTSLGIVRSTFLIGADGKTQKIWDNVKVDGHAETVLGALKSTKE